MKPEEFFEVNKKIAVAFSGGVDSTYLIYAAVKAGADVKAYYVKSVFQPEFEFKDAVKMADMTGCTLSVIEVDVPMAAPRRLSTINTAREIRTIFNTFFLDQANWCRRKLVHVV